ncbi:MAG: hypothetical protein WCP79_02570 [Bacillota bacterium]
MRVTTLIIVFCLVAVSASAAPLTDYRLGKAAVDLYLTVPCIQATNASGTIVPSSAYGMNWGGSLEATVGLGYHIAARIGTDNSFLPFDGRSIAGNYSFSKQNYDLLIGLQSDVWPVFVAMYFGVVDYKISINNSTMPNSFSESGYHFGLQGNYRPTDDVTTYLELAWGTLDTEALIGGAYAFSQNLELNLEVEYNALHGNDAFVMKYNEDIFKIRSYIPKIGITYKF